MRNTKYIGAEIMIEAARQKVLKAAGKFDYTCADLEMTQAERLVVLAEEFGEVAREVCEGLHGKRGADLAKLRTELVQVAAVCASWIQGLDVELGTVHLDLVRE